MSIYRHYTHDLRMGDKALKETDLKPEAHRLMLQNALENVMNEYANILEMLDNEGFEFSHGAEGQISKVFKK